MPIYGRVSSKWDITQFSQEDVGLANYVNKEEVFLDFTDGNGAGQVSLVFQDTRTLAGAATEDLDLNNVLKGPLGGILNFVGIKAMRFRAAAANPGNIRVGGAAANTWLGPLSATAGKLLFKPGASMQFMDPGGMTVVAGTEDQLKIENMHATLAATYTLELLGIA